jgi:gliding motility-associated-like protein
MKFLLMLAISNVLAISLLAQQAPMKNARLHHPHSSPNRFSSVGGTRISLSTLLSPEKLSGFVRQQMAAGGQTAAGRQAASAGQKTPAATQKSIARSKPLSSNCNNNSFFEIAGLTNSAVSVSTITHTQDDGVLIAGELFDSTDAHPSRDDNGYLLKSDKSGNILWATLLEDSHNDKIYYINPLKIKEMQGGDLMMAGYIDTSSDGNNRPVTTIYHLTATGTIIWHTELKSILMQNVNEWVYFSVKDINPGLNGDYILSGTSIAVNFGAEGETVVRMSANGNYIWDTNLTNRTGDYDLGAEGMSAFLNGNSIVAIGVSHGSSLALNTATFFTTLDYATGTVETRRYFINDYPDPGTYFGKALTYYENYAVQLTNGHYLIYGGLLSAAVQSTDTVDYFGVEEFDASFNPVNSWSISSLFHTPYGNNIVYFDNTANGYFSIPAPVSTTIGDVYFSSVRNNQLARQRVTSFGNSISSGFSTQTCFMDDGAYFLADSYYDPASGSYLSLKKLYDTDTSSACLGRDTLFALKLPWPIREDAGYTFLDPTVQGQITPVRYLIGTAGIASRVSNPCVQNSFCQLLQIQGQDVLCGVSQPLLYTAHRNIGCGATPQWNIDTSVVSSLTPVNDSTVSILFKNINWNGKLYASLLPGACQTGVADSLVLNVVGVPQGPVFVPDTILCKGNTIVLHAGSAFSSYLWQDGSKDSTYTVTNAGTYTVAVTDFCGNNYQASTQVVPANFPFTLGPDFSKCNNDTVELKATGGYTNYQWTAAGFNAAGPADSVVLVDPGQNTGYTVTAEKWAGCAVQAGVQVMVNHSPGIHLGNDTSFCSGGVVTLDAGAGFASYAWSTGQTTQQISTGQAGTYTVAASTGQGCRSYDTLRIGIYPLPTFSLGSGADTSICSNLPLLYVFPPNGDSYQWNDGVLAATRTIDQPGTYGLTELTPYGCSTSHSITVTVKPAPQVDLGADTAICSGKDLLLNAATAGVNATYLWQDGSTGPEYTVTKAGRFVATVTAGDGCSSADTIAVSYIGPPEFTLGPDTTLCQGQEFGLQPTVSYAGSYQWQDGSTKNYYLVRDTGLYTLSVSNTCGTASSAIKVVPGLCYLVMPSAFTPNGDGRNDVFRVKYPFSVTQFRMVVYNRWGMQVFQTGNIGEGWDGTFRGAPQPAGTYVWYISLVDIHKGTENAKGTVMLIR